MKRFTYYQPFVLAALVVAASLCAGCSDSIAAPDTSPFIDAEKQAPFFAVTRAGNYIVAANANGLYRARISNRKWERVEHPRKMAPRGYLATSQANSNLVFFCNYEDGLYGSSDSGATWKSLSKEHNFQFVYPHQDGKIYAIIVKGLEHSAATSETNQSASRDTVRWRIMVSDNGGRGWRDISANIASGMMLESIFPDPASSRRVCLRGSGVRAYVLQAADDNYSKWDAIKAWEWRKNERSDDEFLSGGYATSTTYYRVLPNLANYFNYDFAETLEFPAFQMELLTTNFAFSPHDNVRIPVRIRFLQMGEIVKLSDIADGEQFWRIKCIDPAGDRVVASGETNKFRSTEEFEASKEKYRKQPDFKVVDLTSEQPYNREVILSKMIYFSKTGTYRIRLSYDSTAWGWNQGTNGQSTRSDVWGGYFTTRIFTVTIKP